MPEQAFAAFLARLLPRHIARDLFEPAWCDLHIRRLHESETRRHELAGRLRHAIRLVALYLDCWRLALTDLPRVVRDGTSPSVPLPRKERFPVFLYHLRHAVRRLLREPAFTLAAVTTLALGVGANVAVFAVFEAVLLRPLPYPAADQLVILNHRDQRTGITKEFIAIGDYADIMSRQSAFEAIGSFGSGQTTLYGMGDPEQLAALVATSGFLDALRMKPVLGRSLVADDSREGAAPVVLLGYDFWQRRFAGSRDVIGRSVKLGQRERMIVGIAPQGLRFQSTSAADVILSSIMPTQAPAGRKNGWTFMAGRLKPHTTAADATANLAMISKQLEAEYPQSNLGSTYYAMPLRDALVGNSKPAFILLLAAVAVVLLIACVNVANLLLARSLARRREMAIRVALGAGQGRLAVQLMSESLVLAVTAGAAGLVIAHWGAKALVSLVPQSVVVPGLTDVRLNGMVVGFALALTVGTTLVFGLVSLLTARLGSTRAALVAGGKASMSAGARRATSGLVAAEVAFAVVLLFCAGLILQSFASLLGVDPGFKYDRVMTVGIALPADRYRDIAARDAFYSRAFASLRALPEVVSAGAAAVTPLTGNNWTVGLQRADRPMAADERPPEVGWQAASGEYFKALQIPLVAGRVFSAIDRPGGAPVVIVSDALQRQYFPNESAVGKLLKMGDSVAEIVGVVGSIRRAGLRDDPRADLYFPFERMPPSQTTLFIRTAGDPYRPLPSIRHAIRAIEPNAVFGESQSLRDVAGESVRTTQLLLWLLGAFALTALALAVVGIYGVMSYVVRQRTREIGTRIALGAQRGDIVWLVMRQGGAIAVVGAAFGLVIGAAATRLLATVLYRTSALDPVVLTAAPSLLVVATLAACYLPARRAASVDPVETLAQT